MHATDLTISPVRLRGAADQTWLAVVLLSITVFLLYFLAAPLLTVLAKSLESADGTFVGLRNYAQYFTNPGLVRSVWNTALVGVITVAICVPLAFAFVYGLTHTRMRGKAVFRAIAMLPLLAPSLLPAMAFVYLFGTQGLLKDILFSGQIYGLRGICLAQVFFCFPAAVLILSTAMSLGDARLYEASRCLTSSKWLTFRTVTLPACKYGLISACFVVFTLVTTDFGIPKILGGNFGVLSTDVFKQVVGQQNFEMGAVVGVVLLVPSLIAFFVDRLLHRRHVAMFSSRSVPYTPGHSRADIVALVYCSIVSLAIIAVMAVATWASFVKLWPYNFELTIANYQFTNFDVLGWQPYWNSIHLALWAALIGMIVIFVGAYLVEKLEGVRWARLAVQFMAIIPVAVPGVVLGLGYVFFFNNSANPVSAIYGGLAVMIINTVIHFYTVPHLTALTALKQVDREFELVSDSLKASRFALFFRVTLPMCSVAILEIAAYLFVNAMTTIAAVIFLYVAETKTAAIAAINMDDSGMPSVALAWGMMIFYTCAAAKVVHVALEAAITARVQRWRKREWSVRAADGAVAPSPI